MLQAAILCVAMLAVPDGYHEAFAQGKATGRPVYVLLTMDDCPDCEKVKNVGTELVHSGSFTTVNVSRERRLGRRLLAGTRRVPQLLVYDDVRKGWRGSRVIGPADIHKLVDVVRRLRLMPRGNRPPLLVRPVSVVSPVGFSSGGSPLLKRLLERNRRPTGESEAGSQAHYATHFINSEQRGIGPHSCAVYLGGANVYLISGQPQTTLAEVAATVPRSLRGEAYQVYLIQSQRDWNDLPLFVLDEWSAYLAGAQVRADVGDPAATHNARHALEMMVYSFAVCQVAETRGGDYLPATKHLIRVMAERTSQVCQAVYQRQPEQYRRRCGAYVKTLRDSPDAAALRDYIRAVWGEDWTNNLLGF